MRRVGLLAGYVFSTPAFSDVEHPIYVLAGIAAILEFIPGRRTLTASCVILLVAAFKGFPHYQMVVISGGVSPFQDYVLILTS